MNVPVQIYREVQVGDLQALQEKVRLRGGRLLVYDEVMSAFFISIRRYKVKWVASAEDSRRGGLVSSLVTILLGWWAPFGPYWSLTALLWNARGGFDATEALMLAHPGNSSLLGYTANRALNASQDPARRQARLVCVTAILLMVGTLVYLVWSAGRK